MTPLFGTCLRDWSTFFPPSAVALLEVRRLNEFALVFSVDAAAFYAAEYEHAPCLGAANTV